MTFPLRNLIDYLLPIHFNTIIINISSLELIVDSCWPKFSVLAQTASL